MIKDTYDMSFGELVKAGGPGSGRHAGSGGFKPFHRDEENPNHPEAQKAYKVLKQHGYKGFGATKSLTRSFSKVAKEHSDNTVDPHYVHVHRLTGKWSSGHLADPKERVPPASGNNASQLHQHLSSLPWNKS